MKAEARIKTSTCPFCGSGTIGYQINSYVQIVKQCDNCKHTIADDFVTSNYNQSTTVTNTPLSNNLNKD